MAKKEHIIFILGLIIGALIVGQLFSTSIIYFIATNNETKECSSKTIILNNDCPPEPDCIEVCKEELFKYKTNKEEIKRLVENGNEEK